MDSIAEPSRVLPAYESFYGFGQPPFSLTPDPRFLYRSDSHDRAITALLQALSRRDGFIVLTGDTGTGKTTICRAVLEQLGHSTFASLVLNPFLTVDELLRDVLLDFGVVSKEAVQTGRLAGATTHQLSGMLRDFLRSLAPIGANALVVIDEAQHLSPQVLEQIRIVSSLQADDASPLQILLVGQLNLLDVLADAQMRQLNQRISLRATLEPLDREALEAYVNWRLSVARSTTSVAFETAALDLIHTISGGVPRVINLLCDHALAAGAADSVTDITPAHVRTAAAELGLTGPATTGRRMRIAALALFAALAVAVIAVLVAVPADRLVALSRPDLPAEPPRALALPASAYPPPTEDLLLPAPVEAPPVARRIPIPPRSTDPLPGVGPSRLRARHRSRPPRRVFRCCFSALPMIFEVRFASSCARTSC